MKTDDKRKRESVKPSQELGHALRIKKIRTDRNLSQKEYGSAIDVSVPTISRLEQGKVKPDAELILRIASVYECDLLWLMTGEGEPEGTIGELAKRQLMSQMKLDPVFRREILSELGLTPSTDVVRHPRVYLALQAQRDDWRAIVDCSLRATSDSTRAEIENSIKDYREGVAYLDVLLEVGKDPQ